MSSDINHFVLSKLLYSAGSSAIAVGVSTVLSSAAAITTIFGVGGAGKLQ